MVRMNEDSWVMYCALLRFGLITPEACSSPAGLTAQASGGRRLNINREGCINNENDFASVLLRQVRATLLDVRHVPERLWKIFKDLNFRGRRQGKGLEDPRGQQQYNTDHNHGLSTPTPLYRVFQKKLHKV